MFMVWKKNRIPVVSTMAGPISQRVLQRPQLQMSASTLPVAVEHPAAEEDKNQRPEAFEAVLHDAHGVQQEKHAEPDENDSAHGNL